MKKAIVILSLVVTLGGSIVGAALYDTTDQTADTATPTLEEPYAKHFPVEIPDIPAPPPTVVIW